jgi:CcmD family protein
MVLPIAEGGDYVAAAYVVFLALILVYIAIIASKLSRMEKELETLNELLDKRSES